MVNTDEFKERARRLEEELLAGRITSSEWGREVAALQRAYSETEDPDDE